MVPELSAIFAAQQVLAQVQAWANATDMVQGLYPSVEVEQSRDRA
jgi:hypothetical protein